MNQSAVKQAVNDHTQALIKIVRKALTTGQHSRVKTEAREALAELEARLFPGDQGESEPDDGVTPG